LEFRSYFRWWVQNKNALSIEYIVEGVLACGDMSEYRMCTDFLSANPAKRCNDTPRTRHFFKKVFASNV